MRSLQSLTLMGVIAGFCQIGGADAPFFNGLGDSRGGTLTSDGAIVAWGWNADGQCNVPAPNNGFTAVAAGERHGLGLKIDGSVVAWGHNDYGQCDVPDPNSDFIAVAGNGWHSLGLKADGSIMAWGYDGYGLNDIPLPNSGFIAVAAGYVHSLGLKADGSVVAWGYNAEGQCNVPAPNNGFTAVAACGYHSLGVRIPAARVTAAVSRHGCDLNLSLSGPLSEPRRDGLNDLRITFDTPPGVPNATPVTIEERLCPPPGIYSPYTGSAVTNASVVGSELSLSFTPSLENGRTYRITMNPNVTSIAGQFVEVRTLVGDINSDGQVNAGDRSMVVGYWTGPGFGCVADLNDDGITNAADRSIVVGAWTGTQNCAP